jgi:hypothetical protein
MAQNYSGKFIADMIRCFNNKQGFLSIKFDHEEVLEICVGPDMTFNEGKVLRIDNSGETLQIFYGTEELPRLNTRLEVGIQKSGTRYPKSPKLGFFLGDATHVHLDKLEREHLYQLLSLKGCVESGDFFIELYDAPTSFINAIDTVK